MRIDRLNNIEAYVIKHGSASLEELSKNFGISMNTVRRDLKQLLDRGALQKVYGGVSRKTARTLPFSMRDRDVKSRSGKHLRKSFVSP